MEAIRSKNVQMVEFLLSRGANIYYEEFADVLLAFSNRFTLFVDFCMLSCVLISYSVGSV